MTLNYSEIQILLGCLTLAEAQADLIAKVFRNVDTDAALETIRAKLEQMSVSALIQEKQE